MGEKFRDPAVGLGEGDGGGRRKGSILGRRGWHESEGFTTIYLAIVGQGLQQGFRKQYQSHCSKAKSILVISANGKNTKRTG